MEAPCQTSQRNVSEKLEHDQQISKNNPTFEIGQLVIVKSNVHHTFEPEYLLDYRVQYLMIVPS